MPDEFVPLAVLLRAQTRVERIEPPAPPPQSRVEVREDDDAMEMLASEVRRFRARLAEAFDAARAELLGDLACSVLARELLLAPVEIVAIAQRTLERAVDELPIGLRANQEDREQLEGLGLRVTTDSTLRPGDLIVELRDGELDASLGVRLEAILRERRKP